MSATFTSRLSIFSPPNLTLALAQQITEYTAKLLNAGANSLSLRNEVLARNNTSRHKIVANADFKVLNQILPHAPQAEKLAAKRLATPKKQHAIKAHLNSSLMQNIEEKHSPHRDFRTIVDAHKHKKKR